MELGYTVTAIQSCKQIENKLLHLKIALFGSRISTKYKVLGNIFTSL
jgi:hypothetical protein